MDGLKPSKYLIDTAIKNIEGDISIDEAQELLNAYYKENPKADTGDRTEEADKVSVRIAKVDIESSKVDIEDIEVDIRNRLLSFSDTISEKTINHALTLFLKCGKVCRYAEDGRDKCTGSKVKSHKCKKDTPF